MPESDHSRRNSGAGTEEQAGEVDKAVDWDRPETWPTEIGGAKGPEPTRYGDWERNGRCSDF
jgi:hypothetical protein